MTKDLNHLLEQANLADMRCVINELVDLWAEFPVFDQVEFAPAHQIASLLAQTTDRDPLIHALGELDCFSYRAYRTDGRTIEYWNPLEEPWRRFEHRALRSAAKLHYYQSHGEYPPSDVIRAWVRHLMPDAET